MLPVISRSVCIADEVDITEQVVMDTSLSDEEEDK